MSENKRMHSIARRVLRSFLLRVVFTLVVTNLVLLMTALGWTAYTAEKAALGEAWQAELVRDIKADTNLRGWDFINSIEYTYGLKNGEAHSLDAGPILTMAIRAMNALLIAEAVLVFFQYRGFRRRTLYLLTPLRQISQTAEELSRVRFDETAFHSLEDAIENLSVQSPSARLSTGQSELSGLENAVNNLISRMHEAYKQQTRFVSDASHELRTPIAVIRGYADLLSRWGKDDRKVMDESVEAIKDEADNMQRLVEQLLYLARGDAGRTPFVPAKVNLSELVKEAYEEYQLINTNHSWKLRLDEGVYVYGDEAMLKQALRILADNAIKFSPQNSTITLRVFKDDKGFGCFWVQDNGEGIKQADLSHIFERFYRSDPARSRGGTGLGLSIAKWIVDRHQGHIDVFSAEGLGTRFTVNLPNYNPALHEQPAVVAKATTA